MIKKLDRLDVATSDAGDAASTYQHNFGFKVIRSQGSDAATIDIGGTEVRLVSGALAADALKAGGEGMMALWLEAENVDDVIAALRQAGIPVGMPRREHGQRILALDPAVANQVPLLIFDRKG